MKELLPSLPFTPAAQGRLVLTRSVGDSIVVRHAGEELIIEFPRLHDNEARVAFCGPRSFVIVRSELAGDGHPAPAA